MPDERRDAIDSKIEASIRSHSGQSADNLRIEEPHVATATRTLSRVGIKSASVRGWVARTTLAGTHRLWETRAGERRHKWASDDELRTWLLEEECLWAPDSSSALDLRSRLHWHETVNTVRVWLQENEEPTGPPQLLRGEKQKQLRAAKKRMMSARGGNQALLAALALLVRDGTVVLEIDPDTRGDTKAGDAWLQEAAEWMRQRGRIPNDENAEDFVRAAAAAQTALRATLDSVNHWVLDMGEGWGGIRRAVSTMMEGVASVGADRRGFTSVGSNLPKIISRITTDFSTPIDSGYSNLLKKMATLSCRPLSGYLMVWLSVECTLYSQACYMGVSAGTAHGAAALHPLNIAAASPERIAHEMELMIESHLAIENQLSALIQEPGVLFALECSNCAMWDLNVVKASLCMMVGGGHWHLHEVDQCAFGRLEQKPTKILTNIDWLPEGITSKPGCCVLGECAGTRGNSPGGSKHRGRIVQDSRAWRSDGTENIRAAGRRGLDPKAYNNGVACPLVQEIVRAAIAMRDPMVMATAAEE